ncbi:hypothetical protein GOBAR_AA15643 [Gossypium barbadense]|uniref:DUF4283 domain-containing protein n=1 Tax=Gossypium barbadense TaxID=3634 RepID=A0A2P5XP09_GOSBA|nr:hypothetical protein GOBAR_AA15643 [Gossypium barbadense]
MKCVESLPDDRIGDGENFNTDRNTKKISWKDKLLGGSVSNSLDDVSKIDLVFKDGDIRRSNLNGIPSIDFLDRINKILIKGMELTVVVKLLGRNIGYGPLHNHISSLWKPTQPFRLMDVANRYYLIRETIYILSACQWPSLTRGIRSSTRDRSGHGGEVDPRSPLVGVSTLAKMEDDRPTVGEAFGPWMVVECKSRRKQNAIQGQKEKNSDGNLEGSRFEALASTTTESLRSDLEAPSKDLGMAKFIQGDFLKKLKGCENNSGLVLDLNAQIASRDGDLAPAGSGPTSALGFQLQGPSSLVCLGPQQNTGRTPFTSSLGLEGAAGKEMVITGKLRLNLFVDVGENSNLPVVHGSLSISYGLYGRAHYCVN